MAEETIRSRVRESGGGGLPGPFDGPGDAGTFTVVSGVYQENARAGATVGDIRRELGVRLDIDANARAYINGNEVTDGHRVSGGALLMFSRRAGEKGSA